MKRKDFVLQWWKKKKIKPQKDVKFQNEGVLFVIWSIPAHFAYQTRGGRLLVAALYQVFCLWALIHSHCFENNSLRKKKKEETFSPISKGVNDILNVNTNLGKNTSTNSFKN